MLNFVIFAESLVEWLANNKATGGGGAKLAFLLLFVLLLAPTMQPIQPSNCATILMLDNSYLPQTNLELPTLPKRIQQLAQPSTNQMHKQSQGGQLVATRTLKRICYFRMDPQTEIRLGQVDGNLCTHIIMAFARLDSQGNLILAKESDRAYLLEVRELKRNFAHLKVLISVFNEQEFNGFPKLASSAELRQRFARSAIEFLEEYNLDGVDLDWEFPNFPTSVLLFSKEHERTGLTKIIKTLRSAFVENYFDRQVAEQQQLAMSKSGAATSSNRVGGQQPASQVEPYLLTVAIAAQEAILKVSYELRQLANLCDWLNVMSYDYYLFKPYAPFTGPNSPLHPIVDQYVPVLSKLSFSWSVERLLEEGIEGDKICMGIPTYARAYRLLFKSSQAVPFSLSIGSKPPISSGGQRIPDYLDYREVCDLLARPGSVVEFDKRARVPYLLTDNGYTWISFENPQSVREKVRFICKHGLAGYMTWNLNSDHFTGCAQTSKLDETNSSASSQSASFPLHRAMLDELIDHQHNNKQQSGSSTSNQSNGRLYS